MALEFFPAKPEHTSELGRICYEAFKDISDRHHFPSDFTSAAMARMIMGLLMGREHVYGVAAISMASRGAPTFSWSPTKWGGSAQFQSRYRCRVRASGGR